MAARVEKVMVTSVEIPAGVDMELSVGGTPVAASRTLLGDMLADLGLGSWQQANQQVTSNQPIKLKVHVPPGKGKETAEALRALAKEIEET